MPSMKTRNNEVVGVPGENRLILMELENNFARVKIQTYDQMTREPQHHEIPTTNAHRYHKFMAGRYLK